MTGPARARLLRIGGLVLILVALLVAAELTGLRKSFSVAKLRTIVVDAGALGILIYIGAFVVGELLHLPGLIFIAVGVLIWGRLWGGLIGWATALLSIAISFVLVRAIGGKALAQTEQPFLKKMMGHLAARPILTVAGLRAVLMIAPTVTYILALTPVRFSSMMIGSALGLIPPLTLVTFFLAKVLAWIGA